MYNNYKLGRNMSYLTNTSTDANANINTSTNTKMKYIYQYRINEIQKNIRSKNYDYLEGIFPYNAFSLFCAVLFEIY